MCNLAASEAETAGYTAADHVDALRAHGLDVDVVVCHEGGLSPDGIAGEVVVAPIARPGGQAHDPALLADVLVTLV